MSEPSLISSDCSQSRCARAATARPSLAERSKATYDAALRQQGYRPITTEIQDAPPFYYAEAYHQQYLAKNPGGYCGIGGTGVKCSL